MELRSLRAKEALDNVFYKVGWRYLTGFVAKPVIWLSPIISIWKPDNRITGVIGWLALLTSLLFGYSDIQVSVLHAKDIFANPRRFFGVDFIASPFGKSLF